MHRDGEEVHLTPIEFELLSVLARNRGRLMTHRALLTEVWGPAYADDTATLRTHIANLRRKIEPAGGERRYIRTDAGRRLPLRRSERLHAILIPRAGDLHRALTTRIYRRLMTSTALQLHYRREGSMLDHLRARWACAELDRRLAEGADPTATGSLSLRAAQLVKPAAPRHGGQRPRGRRRDHRRSPGPRSAPPSPSAAAPCGAPAAS